MAKINKKTKHVPGFDMVQINLQHSRKGTATLCRTLEELHTGICLIQEPWVVRGKVQGLGGKGSLWSFGNTSGPPRACVLATRNIKGSPLLQFCDRDVVAVLTKWNNKNLVIASVYMDGQMECPPPKMRSLVEDCHQKSLPLLIGCDANAHHITWGSTGVNKRGLELVDYLASTDLHILNTGNKPTFVTSNRREVLDLTLASSSLLGYVTNWFVDDAESSSDHRYIKARVNAGKSDPITCRNRRKTDWQRYTSKLLENVQNLPLLEVEGTSALDTRVEDLTSAIVSAFHQACPERTVRPRTRVVPWWTEELTRLRRSCRRAFRVTGDGSQKTWNEYKEARNAYHYALRKAKRDSWRRFCAEVEGCPAASRLHRILRRDPIHLGALKKGDGIYTDSIQNSFRYLLEEHFPSDPGWVQREAEHAPRFEAEVGNIVTVTRLRRAIMSFGPFKAAGSDGIFPALLQHGIDCLAPHMLCIMRGCLVFGYVPKAWRTMRVVFLPKPGKTTYESPNSWRPISLTSFMLKTLERLIDWHIRTPDLMERLKRAGQFAYMSGVSTEAALHQVVGRLERSLKSSEVAIATFLDIKGAFSDAPFSTMINSLVRNRVNPMCVRFITHMLESRSVETQYMGETFSRRAERGCPQGGVLSPLLWNLVVEELLSGLKHRFPMLYIQGFADDVACISSGPDSLIVAEHMQAALNFTASWCTRVGLSVNDKLSVLFITNRKKVVRKELTLQGAPLSYKDTVKYLGVTIHHRLSWASHCRDRSDKAMSALALCRRALASSWGLSPKLTLWLYTAVIRPMVEYGAVVIAPSTMVKSHMKKLHMAQRQALMGATGALRSTSGAALEAMFGVLPINIRIQQAALQTYHRLFHRGQWLHWSHVGRTQMTTHFDLVAKLGKNVPGFYYPCDYSCEFLPETRKFKVYIRSRTDWMQNGFETEGTPDWTCFTDGSRMEGSSGSAFVVWASGPPPVCYESAVPLGRMITVYQAELRGIMDVGVYLLRESRPLDSIKIYVDNQSSLRALTSVKKVEGLVRETFDILNNLADGRSVTLSWVPSHCGFAGNEAVDLAAKRAANTAFAGPEPAMSVSPSVVKLQIRDWARACHETVWRNRRDCGLTRELVPSLYGCWNKTLVSLPRYKIRFVTWIITGHSPLARHLWKMGVVDSPLCAVCGVEEDTLHFLGECERYSALRYDVLGAHGLEPEDIPNLPISDLVRFIVKSGRFTYGEGQGSAH